MSEVVGSISVVAYINTKDYDAGKKYIEKGNNELESNAKKTSSGFSAAWAGAIGGLVATVAQKGFAMISSSIDSAVKRVDTLNNSTRTFENMGIASIDSQKAMDALQKSIKGLPTPLDGAVRGMTALTATYGNIEQGQKVFSALNNAILGFGGSSAEVDNAITQLSQLPMDGPLDAQTWNSLRNSGLTPLLTAMAKDSGMSVSQMKEAFGSGELTVQDFTDRLVKMNTEGGGGLKSLEKIAKDSTGGIGTGFENMQTAISRGMANIIESIGSANISNAITAIGVGFEFTLGAIGKAVSFIIGLFKRLNVALQPVYKFFNDNILPVLQTVGAFIGGVFRQAWERITVAVNKLMVQLEPFMPQIKMLGAIILAALVAPLAVLAAALLAIITIITAIVTAIAWFMGKIAELTSFIIDFSVKLSESFVSAYMVIYNTFSNIVNWFQGLWDGIKSVFSNVGGWFSNIFQGAWNGIKSVFSGVGSFFRGVWDTIVGTFGKIGTAVGDAIGSAFKNVINTVLKGAINIINGFINAINGAIDVINNIPGVDIGKLKTLDVPQLANGGIVSSPTLAMIGEGRESEAVIPLSKLDEMVNGSDRSSNGATINQTNNIMTEVDMDKVNRDLAWKLRFA